MAARDAEIHDMHGQFKVAAGNGRSGISSGQRRAALVAFSLAMFCRVLLPRLLSYGMFFDGVTYASISRNLAQGYGSIWHPYYTDFVYPQFYEQPPLGFFLQSFAFRVFGDSLEVEAFWGVGIGLFLLILMSWMWRIKEFHPGMQPGAWLPALMLVFIPMTSWLLSNNMLEGTMAVFSSLAVLWAMKSLCARSKAKTLVLAFLAGLAVLAAVLIKGPVGFFPFCVPAAWLAVSKDRPWRIAAMVTAVMFLGFFIPFTWFALVKGDFLYSLSRYHTQQVVASVSGFREKGTNSFWIMWVVLREVIVPFIVGALAWGFTEWKWRPRSKLASGRAFGFYFIVALCASLPIMFSPKQLGWYAFPSLPFYALAIAALFAKPFARLQEALLRTRKRAAVIWSMALLILAGSIGWMIAEKGHVKRQREFHNDFSLQPLAVPMRQVFSVYPPELKHDWALVANMQRQFGASLSDAIGYDYLLTTSEGKVYVDSLKSYRRIHPAHSSFYLVYVRSE